MATAFQFKPASRSTASVRPVRMPMDTAPAPSHSNGFDARSGVFRMASLRISGKPLEYVPSVQRTVRSAAAAAPLGPSGPRLRPTGAPARSENAALEGANGTAAAAPLVEPAPTEVRSAVGAGIRAVLAAGVGHPFTRGGEVPVALLTVAHTVDADAHKLEPQQSPPRPLSALQRAATVSRPTSATGARTILRAGTGATRRPNSAGLRRAAECATHDAAAWAKGMAEREMQSTGVRLVGNAHRRPKSASMARPSSRASNPAV